jgi:hypothetical protein
MNEQGNDLPHQTRKFVLYFSEEVTPHVHQSDNKITFSPRAGGNYNGLVQIAYLGKLELRNSFRGIFLKMKRTITLLYAFQLFHV